ncbi:unnamed protein product [Lupinus luteus]|uniref:C2 domain-containing protein n=1 Tax=Lupinus luteus TaxID=3873 RepID=A0AAV1YGX2_LUPLU
MASRYELEVTLVSAKGLKNVNWRHGKNKPYAVVYVDTANKSTTNIDESGDVEANWDQTLQIVATGAIEEKILHIDIVHNGSEDETKPFIGSAEFNVSEVLKEVGYGERLSKTLTLKRPSGRPQGKVEIKVSVKDMSYQQPAAGYYNPPAYGVPREYAPPAYGGNPYGAPPPYGAAPPAYGGAPPAYGGAPPAYGGGGYAAPPQAASQVVYVGSSAPQNTVAGEKKKSKFGLGAGLAVGALAGGVGALALMGGAEYVEDKIAEKVVEKLEDDYYDDDY